MNEREVVRRLKAFHEGEPLSRGETKHVHIADDSDVLIVAFVRMGGESRPWGIAYGRPGTKPKVMTAAEARNRDLVADMAAEFAPVLLKHLRAPGYVGREPAEADDLLPLRQLWLPNPTHRDMLHHLAFAYTFTRWGAGARGRLNALGRACGWLFREAQRPGQQAVVVATDALRQSYTFPAEDTRQGHLGFLLAWLGSQGDRAQRLDAALEAERVTIATSLDPATERGKLAKHVEAWGNARKDEDKDGMSRAGRAVRKILVPELERRWMLTDKTRAILLADARRTNNGVAKLVEGTASEQWFQYSRLELRHSSREDGPAFTPSVETDRNAAAAASRFFVHNASADLVEGLLVHDDAELLAEAIAEGDAIKGTIVAVRDDAPPHTGRGRPPTRPVWVVRDDADRQLRLRTGSEVCLVGVRGRTARLRAFRETSEGDLEIELEIKGWRTRRPGLPSPHDLPPNDVALVGCEVGLVATTLDGLSRSKSLKVWSKDGPGAWLTHAAPGGVRAQHADVDQDDVRAVRDAEASE